MKILVTGSDGFIGQHYCNHAERDSIIAKADKSSGIDISKDRAVFEQFGECDAVLHLAKSQQNNSKSYNKSSTERRAPLSGTRIQGLGRLATTKNTLGRQFMKPNEQ